MGVRIPSLLLAGLVLLPAAGLADLQKGLAAYNSGDYETSLNECLPIAEQGDAVAQFCVGRLYANGFGVAMDDALALQWYGRAAEQGHAEAQFNLGVMHANGWGVPMNDDEAARLYGLAAEQGFVPAQMALAAVYHNGRGVPQSDAEAYTWYTIAAALGESDAAFKRDELAEKIGVESTQAAQEKADGWLDAFKANGLRADRND